MQILGFDLKKLHFKNYFITGLVTITPLWLTLFILIVLFKWISGLAIPFFTPFVHIMFGNKQSIMFLRIFSFLLTIFVIWFAGFLATNLVGRRLLVNVESLFIKVPILSEIYVSIKKLISFFTQERSFKRVALIEFPRKGMYSIGFVTYENPKEICEKTSRRIISVFVPTVPNPTSGFLLQVPEEEVIQLDMGIDDAVRIIVSGGIVSPDGKKDWGGKTGPA